MLHQLAPEDVELLLETSRVLASTLDLNTLLRVVIKTAGRVVKAEAASLLLLDEKTGELYFDVTLGDAGDQLKRVRLKVGEGLAGWVAREREPAVVNDAKNDARWAGRVDAQSDFTTRQILAVPLMAKARLIGVVEAINHVDGSPFSDSDLRVFEAFAAHAAVAIENARLFAEVTGEKEKLSTIFAEMSDGAVLLDEAGRVQIMNAAAGALFGIDPQSARDRLAAEIVQGFMAVPPLPLIFERQESEATVELKRKEGKAFYLSCVLSRLSSADGRARGYLMVVRDVTESRKEELLKRNFLSLVSHKLKTPLVTIAGYTPLLLEDAGALTDFQKKALQTIKTQGMHLSSLVDKLISFSLVESETLDLISKPISLKAILSEVLSNMRPYLEAHKAKVDVSPGIADLPRVMADTERVREVLRNLIENAVKFNKKPAKLVSVEAALNGSSVRISVKDDGPGIPSEEHVKIFQKFYQIEESFTGQVEGAGLGLALVRRIIEAHGGTSGVESALGRGSVFYFTLAVEGAV
jgi:PAS domain S-box-containing protein